MYLKYDSLVMKIMSRFMKYQQKITTIKMLFQKNVHAFYRHCTTRNDEITDDKVATGICSLSLVCVKIKRTQDIKMNKW